MNKPTVSFAVAGDMLIQRLIPTDYPGFAPLSAYIHKQRSVSAIWKQSFTGAAITETSLTAARTTAPIPGCWTSQRPLALT